MTVPSSSIVEDQLRRARSELERGLRGGEDPRAETLLDRYPELAADTEAALELVYTEFVLRAELGQNSTPDQWYERFPHWRADLEQLFQVHEEVCRSEADRPSRTFTPPLPIAAGPIPNRIAGYEILDELGRGGMGVVYRARQLALNRIVALKVILAGSHAGEKELARFRLEAQAAARLDHPNIVHVYEIGEYDGRPFCAMEFVAGGSLAQRLKSPWRTKQAAELVVVLARAAQHAHDRGIVHRDLKPGNILLASTGEAGANGSHAETHAAPTEAGPQAPAIVPKIADFGLAKCLRDVDSGPTRTGEVLGTPAYMAPEQAAGQSSLVGPGSDIWALGVILYELLTGHPPFQGDSEVETMQQLRSSEPVSPRRLRPHLPRDLETICLRCIEKSPGCRYASAAALADDVERWLRGEPIVARPIGPAGRLARWCGRNPVIASLLALVTALVLVILIGAPIASVKLLHERNAARKAEETALDRLYDSCLTQAALYRGSSQVGRRALSLERVADAARIRLTPEVRDEGVACLALTDLRLDRQWRSKPSGVIVAFDPQFSRYARDDADGTVVILSVADDSEIARLQPPVRPATPRALMFSPDGRRLAVNYSLAPATFRLVVWDLERRAPAVDCPSGWMAATSAVFLADNRRLVASLPGDEIGVVDLASGAELKRFPGIPQLESVAVDAAGKHVALSSALNQLVVICDIDSGEVVEKLPMDAGARGLAWGCNDELLAIATDDRQVHLWNAVRRRWHAILRGAKEGVIGAAFSTDGELLLATAANASSQLWDPRTGQLLVTVPGFGLQFRGDDRRVALLDESKELSLWEVVRGQACRVLYPISLQRSNLSFQSYRHIAFSPDGEYLTTAGIYGVHLLNLHRGGEASHASKIPSSACWFHPRKNALVNFDRSGTSLLEFNKGKNGTLQQGRLLHLEEPPAPAVFADASLSAGASCLAYLDDAKREVVILDLDRPDSRTAVPFPSRAGSVALSPDGRILAVAAAEGERSVSIIDRATKRVLAEVPDSQSATVERSLAFSPDGRWLAIGGPDACKVHDTSSWLEVKRIPNEPLGSKPGPIAFTPDSRMLALATAAQNVRLIDVATAEIMVQFPLLDAESVAALAFSADGRKLAVAGNSPAIQVWDLAAIQDQLGPLGVPVQLVK